jgi:hypothetical protein
LPLIIVPTRDTPAFRALNAFKAGSLLLIGNVLWGGGLALWIQTKLNLVPDAQLLWFLAAGGVFAQVVTGLVLLGLYWGGARAAAPHPFGVMGFLDEMLYALLGSTMAPPIAAFGIYSAWETWRSKQTLDWVMLGFGLVAALASLTSLRSLVGFIARTRPDATVLP